MPTRSELRFVTLLLPHVPPPAAEDVGRTILGCGRAAAVLAALGVARTACSICAIVEIGLCAAAEEAAAEEVAGEEAVGEEAAGKEGAGWRADRAPRR